MLKSKKIQMKKIYAITSVRNEEDIIESFIRYSLCIVDGMVVNENFSSDGTLEILKNLKKEGLNIEIIEDKRAMFPQERRTNELLSYTMEKYKPDWVFSLDADEFLACREESSLIEAIELLNPLKINLFEWETYVFNGEEEEILFIPEKFKYVRNEKRKYCKTAMSKELYEKGTSLSIGSHELIFSSSENLKREVNKNLYIAHYPVRSAEQISKKIILGVLNKLTQYPKDSDTNYHQQRIYDQMIKKGTCIDNETLHEISKMYAIEDTRENPTILYKPLNLDFCKSITLKYSRKNDLDNDIFSYTLNIAEVLIEGLREEKEKTEKSLETLQEEHNTIKKSLDSVVNSKGWKVVERLRELKRIISNFFRRRSQ